MTLPSVPGFGFVGIIIGRERVKIPTELVGLIRRNKRNVESAWIRIFSVGWDERIDDRGGSKRDSTLV